MKVECTLSWFGDSFKQSLSCLIHIKKIRTICINKYKYKVPRIYLWIALTSEIEIECEKYKCKNYPCLKCLTAQVFLIYWCKAINLKILNSWCYTERFFRCKKYRTSCEQLQYPVKALIRWRKKYFYWVLSQIELN